MLKRIELENYRCFKRTSLKLKDITIIVGKNNAGKSTIIEALRLISYVCKRYKTVNYADPHNSLNVALHTKGINIPVTKLKIDLRSIVRDYVEENAKITAYFENNVHIIIHLNRYSAFAVIFSNNKIIKTKSAAKIVDVGNVQILPQIGLIKKNEPLLQDATIKTDMDTYLTSRHFRNELYLYKDDYFKTFKELAENTWEGLRILNLEYDALNSNHILLMVEDGHFPSEIGLMGSGLQMWLQMIWFIIRTHEATTIVLDEPDVYMHPDLQRKILRILKNRYRQIVIATHSVEIISDVEPRNIVAVDKNSRSLKFSSDIKGVQALISSIGSIHNIALVRLANSKKCLFVEGNDLKYLSFFHQNIAPNSDFLLENLPCISIGGRSRLHDTFGTAKLLFTETAGEISTICILDRDCCSDKEIEKEIEKAHLNSRH